MKIPATVKFQPQLNASIDNRKTQSKTNLLNCKFQQQESLTNKHRPVAHVQPPVPQPIIARMPMSKRFSKPTHCLGNLLCSRMHQAYELCDYYLQYHHQQTSIASIRAPLRHRIQLPPPFRRFTYIASHVYYHQNQNTRRDTLSAHSHICLSVWFSAKRTQWKALKFIGHVDSTTILPNALPCASRAGVNGVFQNE